MGEHKLRFPCGGLKPGDTVEKISGYKWPGKVVASFKTLGSQSRVVVECTVPEVEGALHIYSPDQLRFLLRDGEI